MDVGAWRRRTAARGLCEGLNNAGVASRPEDVADFTRRERKQVNGSNQSQGPARVKTARRGIDESRGKPSTTLTKKIDAQATI